MGKPTILVIQDYFLPAYKGGGSVRTVVNILERLGDDFEFDVLCRDRDRGDVEPFPNLGQGWTRVGGGRVRYLPPAQITLRGLRAAAAQSDYSLIYFNSFFSTFTVYLLLLRRLGLLPNRPVLLAPRGELAAAPLAIKKGRKTLFLRVARWLGLYRGIAWHASSEAERQEILAHFDEPVDIAADLPAPPPDPASLPPPPPKRPGELRLVFLSRLARKKNLPRAIALAGRIPGQVVFDIYGTVEAQDYLDECQALIDQLPPNVRCRYVGPIPYELVHATLAGYHVFLFPTLNENFGHVILEALLARLPVVISDTTFWRGLEARGAGFDLPLDDDGPFVEALTRFANMDQAEYDAMSRNAVRLAYDYLSNPAPVADQRDVFFRHLRQKEG